MLWATQKNINNTKTRYLNSTSNFQRKKYLLNSTTDFSNLSSLNQKLPRLNRSSSSFSTNKNAKCKVNLIDIAVRKINADLHDLRLQTKESLRFAQFLKEDLVNRQLNGCKLSIINKINQLQKIIKISRKSDQDCSRNLRNDTNKLQQSSKALKNTLMILNDRLDKAQDVLGIYSGRQKHKI